MKDQGLFLMLGLLTSIREENRRQLASGGFQDKSIQEWIREIRASANNLGAKMYDNTCDPTVTAQVVYEEAITAATLFLKIAEMYLRVILLARGGCMVRDTDIGDSVKIGEAVV